MSFEQIVFIVISGIALILILLPLPWHWSARNYGTLLYIGWTFSGTLMYFVNAIVWTGNLENPAPVWCDISAKLAMGLGVALPAVSLCINRRLFNIATMKIVELSPRQRLHQTLIDFGIGLGIPVLVMILHYVVQGHRFDIIEDVGCVPTTYHTALMIPLVLMWPLLLGLVSMVYGVLAMRAFMKQRRTFSTLLNSKSSNLNVSRYLRLMALAGTDIGLDLPLSSYIAYSNLRHGLAPWVSWSDTHYNFSHVNYVPKNILQEVPGAWATLTINRWALPIACILFFLFFGLAGESIAFYRRVIRRSITLLHFPHRSHAKLQVTASSPQGDIDMSRKWPAFPKPTADIQSERSRKSDIESGFRDDDEKLFAYVPLPSPTTLKSTRTAGSTKVTTTFPKLDSAVGHSTDLEHNDEKKSPPSSPDTPHDSLYPPTLPHSSSLWSPGTHSSPVSVRHSI